MFENKFFKAQTYTNTAIERSRARTASDAVSNAVLRVWQIRWIDWSSDLFNKPVWTKLNELPDSLSHKKIGVYILFLEQSNYHEYHLTSLSNLPKCKVEIVKTSYKGASLLREVLQLQIDSPSQNLKKRTCVICLSTTSLLLSISGISVAISGIPGSHVSGGFSSAC